MITKEAIRRTVEELDKRPSLYGMIGPALELILKNQDDIDEEKEKQHNEIINEIGQT